MRKLLLVLVSLTILVLALLVPDSSVLRSSDSIALDQSTDVAVAETTMPSEVCVPGERHEAVVRQLVDTPELGAEEQVVSPLEALSN
ncbi:MAG: hypothetical protein KDD44_01025, partial [Bdellovibrionales bacterium]|nr:hypothetical protein [Bdellovibrionales bacterium]